MTTANKITIARILLIPVFVGLAVHYAETLTAGHPIELYRWASVGMFLVISVGDALDGFIARRYNQRSRLGVILDPVADKGLLLAAMITLTVSPWQHGFPLWFLTLVIGRDAILIVSAFVIHYATGAVRIRPHWTGKIATVLQMTALAWVMLAFPLPQVLLGIIIAAGIFTFVSAAVYFTDGIGQFHASGHGEPDSDN